MTRPRHGVDETAAPLLAQGSRAVFTPMKGVVVIVVIVSGLTGMSSCISRGGHGPRPGPAARAEMGQLMAAFGQYAVDWGEYPPDNNTDEGWNSARCLVFYLGAEFVAGERPKLPWDGRRTANFVAAKTRKPLFHFPQSRLKDDGHFEDPWGKGGERDVWYYQFDNNQVDRGLGVCDGIADYGEWEANANAVPGDTDYNNWNVTNWRRNEIDIWCAGPDGTDMLIDDVEVGEDDWEVDADSPTHYRAVMDSIKLHSDDILGLGH
jgi:hypothetical protein